MFHWAAQAAKWPMTGNAALSSPRSADPGSDEAVADANLRALAEEPVAVREPRGQRVPFIFASPHSGRFYPLSFAQSSRLDPISLRRSEDAFVDELFDSVTELGAPLICARFPRAFVDANRAPGELDPAMFDAPLNAVGPRSPRVAAGLGVIPRVVRDGLEIYGTRLPAGEAAFRLEHFYRPYHAALAGLVEQTRAAFGVAVVIDCHSMPPPAKAHDIVLGDCYGEAAAPELIGQTQRILSGLGFSVARNAPYAGGYTTHLYGRPHEGVHAIQIEVSRALYLDETLMEKSAGFASCRDRLRAFAAKLLAEAGAVLKTPRRAPR
jgi:N-formylglutamate deformylase